MTAKTKKSPKQDGLMATGAEVGVVVISTGRMYDASVDIYEDSLDDRMDLQFYDEVPVYRVVASEGMVPKPATVKEWKSRGYFISDHEVLSNLHFNDGVYCVILEYPSGHRVPYTVGLGLNLRNAKYASAKEMRRIFRGE